MAAGDRPEEAPSSPDDLHWLRWHEAYENPDSPLSFRLRLVQAMVRDVLDRVPTPHAEQIRIVSMCAGQGRDVIDVVARHPRRDQVSALLVELDPKLVAFARERAASSGVAEQVRIEEGDASLCRWYAAQVSADLVLACGIFGNISAADISRTVQALPGFCRPGSEVIWTRHRRPPDATPSIRADFAAAGFEEVSFEDPDGFVLAVGRHRLTGDPGAATATARAFDPAAKLFDFVGDGFLPA